MTATVDDTVPQPGRRERARGERKRRREALARLREADGISYDDLIRHVMERCPVVTAKGRAVRWETARLAVLGVRGLLSDGLAVTESDESVRLTPEGWAAR
jgi:hypothetical protein